MSAKNQMISIHESNVCYYSKLFPDVFSHASGSYIYNTEGRAYLDFFQAPVLSIMDTITQDLKKR